MSLHTASLNSGSNGNCYYVGNENEAVLIDAGISGRETEKRFRRLGLSMDKVKAIFISHEHSDHITGLEGLSKRFSLPVYISKATKQNSNLSLREDLTYHFLPGQTVEIGSLRIHAFSKRHDAADPFSFTIENEGVTIGVFTDIGSVCENLIHHFSKCHAAYLETNYDEPMLVRGHYPAFLKKRITADNGHLSNTQALDLFRRHRSPALSHLFFAHLSRENNHPKLVEELFEPYLDGVELIHASRTKETGLYFIDGKRQNATSHTQLSLF